MEPAVAEQGSRPLDTKSLLARINARLALLRSWLSHDHHDEPFWWARKLSVQAAQAERIVLKQVANLLHVERATARGRLHGTWFSNLDEQRAWLAKHERRSCRTAAAHAGLPDDATLEMLRAGRLSL